MSTCSVTSSTADRQLAVEGRRLAQVAQQAVPAWVVRTVSEILDAWCSAGHSVADRAAVLDDAAAAGRVAAAEVGSALRRLAETDVDRQATTPLAVVRRAVVAPTDVLRRAGVGPIERDAAAQQLFPDDLYGLVPGSLGVLDPALGEIALRWGAAKAMAHRQRHRAG